MRVSVDTGGTFTDFVACTRLGETHFLKRPSTPHDPAEAILLGLSALEEQTGEMVTRVDHGTTVATNAILENKTAPTILVTNSGFEDLLLLGRQNREHLFALEPTSRTLLLPRSQVLGIEGRLDAKGNELIPLAHPLQWIEMHRHRLEQTESIAICLLHSCCNPVHERLLAAAIEQAFPEIFISNSHQIANVPREYERAQATVANALVQPIMHRYLGRLQSARPKITINVMSSSGGLMDIHQARSFPCRTLLSGPAGGVVGAWSVGSRLTKNALLSLDMGGTSTDVAAGKDLPTCVEQGRLGVHPIAQEMLPVETVGAGGGSIAWIDPDGLLQVGPQSAGAFPGPVAYGQGGQQPTVTDANVVLGRLPSLLGGQVTLDEVAAKSAMKRLADALDQSIESTAQAIIAQAEVRMARACRRVTVARGIDPEELCLIAFGGAGPLHAAAVCEELGCREFLVPHGAGVLSAWGIAHAKPRAFRQKSITSPLNETIHARLPQWFANLKIDAQSELNQAVKAHEFRLRLRYRGQGSSLQIVWCAEDSLEKLKNRFEKAHVEGFGFAAAADEIEIAQLHAEVTGSSPVLRSPTSSSSSIQGPQVLLGMDRTVWLPEGWTAERFDDQTLRCFRDEDQVTASATTQISLTLEVHHQRLAAIAEEMGERLCRTARSTNIKERRDYSCAVFDAKGRMLSHAAHIPVHLGATPATVQAVINSGLIKPDAEVLVNDPYTGGSHLPDLCLVSAAKTSSAGLVANRAHHADIGGITPGSLPSSVTPQGYRKLTIHDEGFRLQPTPWSSEVIDRIATASRSPWERRGDLHAQKAANQAGLSGLLRLYHQLGASDFHALNQSLLELGESRMTRCLHEIPDGVYSFEDYLDGDGLGGGPLPLSVQIEIKSGRACVDLREVPDQVASPINASRAVTESAVLYVFCCLAGDEMPANSGMLRPIDILTRPGSLLDPVDPAPVSSGNVETSQRIVDCLMGALAKAVPHRIPAASGGSMNNLLFGALDGRFVHYETLACGAGAGPKGPGADGIQVHMTNTLNTPIERLEQCFPVRVEGYSLAPRHSGNGGRGVCRSLRFLEPVELSLSGERRKLPPWGLHGALPGRRGHQYLTDPQGVKRPLPGKISLIVEAGSVLHLESPGGGAWRDWSNSQVLAMRSGREEIHD